MKLLQRGETKSQYFTAEGKKPVLLHGFLAEPDLANEVGRKLLAECK